MKEKVFIDVGNESIAGLLDYEDDTKTINTFVFHGGGPSTKENTEYLIPVLQQNSKNCLRIDFSGHGDSSGKIVESSLLKRQEEARTVINKYYNENNKITLIGSSMAGHIVCSLASEYNIENIILFCPAAYSIEAWRYRFDNGFTEIIRQNNSYRMNNIKELLESYSGKMMLILPEKDEVIPSAVSNLYVREVKKRNNSIVYTITGCPHPIHRWVISKEEQKRNLLNAIDSFLKL